MTVYTMKCYKLVPPKEGEPGWEQEPVFVAAKSLGEALQIADQIPMIKYSVCGILELGRISMDVHKMPEATAEAGEILHDLLHQHGTRPHTEDDVKAYFQKKIGRDCPCPLKPEAEA